MFDIFKSKQERLQTKVEKFVSLQNEFSGVNTRIDELAIEFATRDSEFKKALEQEKDEFIKGRIESKYQEFIKSHLKNIGTVKREKESLMKAMEKVYSDDPEFQEILAEEKLHKSYTTILSNYRSNKIDLNTCDTLLKAVQHKYIRKTPDGKGGWNYVYEEEKGKEKNIKDLIINLPSVKDDNKWFKNFKGDEVSLKDIFNETKDETRVIFGVDLNKLIKNKRVFLDDLIPSQPTVSKDVLINKINEGSDDLSNPVIGVKNGKKYIISGHHKLALSKLKNDSYAKVDIAYFNDNGKQIKSVPQTIFNNIQKSEATFPFMQPYLETISEALNNKKETGKVKYADNIIFNKEGKLLLLKRSENDKTFAGMYAIPGGHVDLGEDCEAAAKRELYEEAGIEVEEVRFVGEYEDKKVHIKYYESHTDKDPVLQQEEIWGYEWIELKDLDNYPMPLNMCENIKKVLNPYDFKRQIVKIKKALEDDLINPTQYKALMRNVLEKAKKAHSGEIRTWGNDRMQKQPDGSWKKLFGSKGEKKEEENELDPRGGVYNSPEYKLAKKVQNILKERGIEKNFNVSNTDFGNSMYFTVYGENMNQPKLKIRISDHSVGNKDRIFNEQHESATSDPERIANDVELAMHPERYNKIESGKKYWSKYDKSWVLEKDIDKDSNTAWIPSNPQELNEDDISKLEKNENVKITSKSFLRESKSGKKVYKVDFKRRHQVDSEPVLKYVRKEDIAKSTESTLQKALEDNLITPKQYDFLLEKAWTKHPVGTVVTRKDGTRWKKISETGNSKADWKQITKDKGNKPEDAKEAKNSAKEEGQAQTPTNLTEAAKNASETALNEAIKTSGDENIRQAAHEELNRREKEEKVQEEPEKKEEEKETDKEENKSEPIDKINKLEEELNSSYKDLTQELINFIDYDNTEKLKELQTKQKDISRFIQNIKNLSNKNIEEESNKLKESINFEGEIKDLIGDGEILSLETETNKKGTKVVALFEDGYTERFFDKDKEFVEMEFFYLNPLLEKGKGKGTEIFKNQVDQFKKLGFKSLKTLAGNIAGMNGYYTWARLGYELNDEFEKNALLDMIDFEDDVDLKGNKTLQDIMSSNKGRKWWKEYGFAFNGVFDLRDDSISMKTLKNYKHGQ